MPKEIEIEHALIHASYLRISKKYVICQIVCIEKSIIYKTEKNGKASRTGKLNQTFQGR